LAQLNQTSQQSRVSLTIEHSPREQVVKARALQLNRQGTINAQLHSQALAQYCNAADIEQSFLEQAIGRYNLSARSVHKIWRIARTIADLEAAEAITLPHMAEALTYRALDWEAGVF